jgi:hypothetical protein
MDTAIWIGIAVAILVMLALGWAAYRMRNRRIAHRFEVESVDRQERAADREAEAGAILQEAERDRRMAEEAAERARELQAEADARAARSLEREADAEQVSAEADDEARAAEEARAEAARHR